MLHPGDATDRKDTQEHIPLGARSPHPYRRQSLDIPDRLFVTNLAARDRHPHTAQHAHLVPRISRIDSDGSDYFSRERDTRHAITTSPSDSGTEADDEKPYMKGLPPAHAKSRKGFKGSSGAVTPSDFDGIKEALLVESRSPSGYGSEASGKPPSLVPEEKLGKYISKWRSELFRRVLEILFVYGLTRSTLVSEMELSTDSRPHAQEEIETRSISLARLCCDIFFGGSTVYIATLVISHLRAVIARSRDMIRRVPAPADPAPALYPVLLPVCITAIVTSSWMERAEALCTNLVLALGAFTRPSDGSGRHFLVEFGYTLTVILVLGRVLRASDGAYAQTGLSQRADDVWFLLPLLDALIPTIQYYCGSSLLVAETKLLAIGLVNLLAFASAPQAVILSTLMWVGGITLLISCRHIMKWSTMLARIPGWRFRSPRHGNAPQRKGAEKESSAIATILQASSFLPDLDGQDSSSDRDWITEGFPNGVEGSLGGSAKQNKTASGLDTFSPDLHVLQKEQRTLKQSGRRHTFPIRESSHSNAKTFVNSSRRKRTKRRPFLWLTRTQASIVKWLYAAYCYAMAVGTILLPVRWCVQRYALQGQEPVGWALGYLFGDMPMFRLHVLLSQLDDWILLPPRVENLARLSSYSFDRHRYYTIGAANTRLLLAGWCVLNLLVGIGAVLQLRSLVEVDTRRKVFHGMMVSMFLPSIFVDPCFVALALTLMLAIFLLLDVFRASQLPPISRPLTHFLAPYVDGRDHKGPIVISPIFLLIGCAIPLWLSLACMDRGSDIVTDTSHPWHGWELPRRDLGMVAGVICVGMGDAAASLIGRRYGKRRWIWSGGKSLEGSAAFVLAVTVGLIGAEIWRRLGGWPREHAFQVAGPAEQPENDALSLFVAKAIMAGTGASFTEAVLTGGNDNVIVPVVLWLLVKLLKI